MNKMKNMFFLVLTFILIGAMYFWFFVFGSLFLLIGSIEKLLVKIKFPHCYVSLLRKKIIIFADSCLEKIEAGKL